MARVIEEKIGGFRVASHERIYDSGATEAKAGDAGLAWFVVGRPLCFVQSQVSMGDSRERRAHRPAWNTPARAVLRTFFEPFLPGPRHVATLPGAYRTPSNSTAWRRSTRCTPWSARSACLVQLGEYVAPDNIFTEYSYFSSYSDSGSNTRAGTRKRCVRASASARRASSRR